MMSNILMVLIPTTNHSVSISPPQKLKMCKDYLGFWGLGRKPLIHHVIQPLAGSVKILIILLQRWLTSDFIVRRCHVEAMGLRREPHSRRASQQMVGYYLGLR